MPQLLFKCFIHQSLSWSVYRTITLHFLGVIFWSDIIVNGKASYNRIVLINQSRSPWEHRITDICILHLQWFWWLITYMTYIKRIKTSIDDRHCRGETTHRQNKLWQFIANIMIYIKNIYYTNIIWCRLAWCSYHEYYFIFK